MIVIGSETLRLPQIPPEAEKWIRLHRTNLVGAGEKLLEGYWQSICTDFIQMAPYLPDKLSVVLDIGCGLAGLDILLVRQYGMHLEVLLMDGSGETPHKFGFRDSMEPYNDMGLTEQFLNANGVLPTVIPIPQRPIEWHENFPPIQLGLVVSLLSWGHHYPVSTYLDSVMPMLQKGGKLILDVRRGHGGMRYLMRRSGLKYMGQLHKHKSRRVCFERC